MRFEMGNSLFHDPTMHLERPFPMLAFTRTSLAARGFAHVANARKCARNACFFSQ